MRLLHNKAPALKLVLSQIKSLMNAAELFRHETNTLKLAPGEFLYREGDKADDMYVLLEGEIDIRVGDHVKPQGKAHSLDRGLDRRQAACCQRRGEVRLPTGANRSATVRFSCPAAPAVASRPANLDHSP